jgi:hypothetical protein
MRRGARVSLTNDAEVADCLWSPQSWSTCDHIGNFQSGDRAVAGRHVAQFRKAFESYHAG